MKRRRLISVVVLMLLLFNLAIGVFAGGHGGTTRPDRIPIPPPSNEGREG
jgi:hypothetical protein